MNAVALVDNQLRQELRIFRRNPMSALFTFALPILLVVIFATLLGTPTIAVLGGIRSDQFYVPSFAGLGVMGASFAYPAVLLCIRRDLGTLKRLRATPLPAWAYFGGLMLTSMIVSAVIVTLIIAMGAIFYHVGVPAGISAVILTVLIGSLSFSALGIAFTVAVPNAEASWALVNGVFYLLTFVSGTFFPLANDSVIAHLTAVFPVRAFTLAMFSPFDPRRSGPPLAGLDLVVVGIWGIAALTFALRYFQWQPRRS
jgi:ABC-2 type transport system permease protein